MNLQLKSAKSYWVYKRDECLSVLDILLNNSCSGENVEIVQKKINETIREISICIKSIEVVDELISNSKKEFDNLKDESKN